jgi:hypothetical protein
MGTAVECEHVYKFRMWSFSRNTASALSITTAAYFVFSIRNFKLPLYSVGKKRPNDVVYTLDKAAAVPATACSGPPVDKAGWNPIQNSWPTYRNSVAPSWL